MIYWFTKVGIAPGLQANLVLKLFSILILNFVNISFEFFPDQIVQLAMLLDEEEFSREMIKLDPLKGNDCSTQIADHAAGKVLNLEIESQSSVLLFDGELVLSDNQEI